MGFCSFSSSSVELKYISTGINEQYFSSIARILDFEIYSLSLSLICIITLVPCSVRVPAESSYSPLSEQDQCTAGESVYDFVSTSTVSLTINAE